MRGILNIVFLMLGLGFCSAQTPIFDIEDLANITQDIYGAYHKDTNNQLNAYEGTYLYTNGNTSLEIRLRKVLMSSVGGYYYEDLIIGEYKYISDGLEAINTLDKFLINYPNQGNHAIDGNFILTGTELGCDECGPTEKRLRVGLVERSTQNIADMDIRRIQANGQPAIEIWITWIGPRAQRQGMPNLPRPIIPGGKYVLIKQP